MRIFRKSSNALRLAWKSFWNSRVGYYIGVFCIIQKLYVIPLVLVVVLLGGMSVISRYGNDATIHINTEHIPIIWVTPAPNH